MMAGKAICQRELIRREALDDFILDRVRLKLNPLPGGRGRPITQKTA